VGAGSSALGQAIPRYNDRLKKLGSPVYWQALAAIGEHFAVVCAPDLLDEDARLMADSATMLWRLGDDHPAPSEVNVLLDRWKQLESGMGGKADMCMQFLEYALEEYRDPVFRHAAPEFVEALTYVQAQDIRSGMRDDQPAKYRATKEGNAPSADELVQILPELRREDAYLDHVISLAEEADQAGRPLRRDDVLRAVRDLDIGD
jgi:hypothetical protein